MKLLVFVLGAFAIHTATGAIKGGRQREHYQQYIQPSRIQEGTVKQVHIIFRHGDRAPIGTYHLDPNKNHEWPFGRAQLTDVGKRQHYELGTYLRDRYSQLLTSDPREVFALSSDKDRCIASMQSNLAAFYRPSGKWVWNENLPWQPVPIHTAPGESDWLLNEDSKCPAAEEIKKNVMKTPEGERYAQKYERLFRYVTENSGEVVHDPTSVLKVYGITYINKLNNLTIPPWVDVVWNEFTHAADDAFVVGYSSKPFLRMRGGPLLGHIISLMKKYDKDDHSTLQPKAYMYSTHDATIAAFLNAVGVFNGLQIPYATTVLVELHEHQRPVNRYTVRMYYRNTTSHEPFQLIVPNCLPDCPLADFEQLLWDMIPKDIRAECYGLNQNSQHTTPDAPRLIHQTGSGTQCCCCSQCGSVPTELPSDLVEKLKHGPVSGEDRRVQMQQLLMQMRALMEQHRQSVDRSVQELIDEMDGLDQGLQRTKQEYKDMSERLAQPNTKTRGHGQG